MAGEKTAAGVFTQGYATQLVLDALELPVERGVMDDSEVTMEKLKGFLGEYGRAFYGVGEGEGEMLLERKG